MRMIDAMMRMHDRYGSVGWPSDWYNRQLTGGWAFVSPQRPHFVVVVADSGRIDDLDPREADAQEVLAALSD